MKSNNKGFTLLEMLVTVMLLGLVMTMLTSFVSSSSRQYSKGTREARMQMEAQETMNFIEKLVTDGAADTGCFSFASNVFTAYILKDTTLSKYTISFDQSEKMLRYTRQDKIYGAYDATSGKPIVEPGSASMNSGWAAVTRQNIPLSKYVSGFSVDLSELSSLGMFRVNLDFSLEGANYSASRTYNIRNISEINERTKWINSLGEEDFDSEGTIYRGQTIDLNDYAKNILKLTDTYTSWTAKAGAENNDQIATGSTAQITLENGKLTVKAGYDWSRDIKLQLVGQTADGTTQAVNLHLAEVTIVGENKTINKSDLVGQNLVSNVKGILADNTGLSFKLFYSANKISDYTNGFNSLSGITLQSGQQSTLMSGGSAIVKVTTAKEVSQGAGISKNRLSVMVQEYPKNSAGYLYIVPYKSGSSSNVIQTSGVAEIAITDASNPVTEPTEAPTQAPTQAPTEAPTQPYVEPTTQAVVTALEDDIVLENLKATITGASVSTANKWSFDGSFNVQLTGATGMSHSKLQFRVYTGSTSGFNFWNKYVSYGQAQVASTSVSGSGSYLNITGVVTVNDISQSEIETASVRLNFGPGSQFSDSIMEYLNNFDKCIEVYYAGQRISPAASYAPSQSGGGNNGGNNNGGGGTQEPTPGTPNSVNLTSRLENGTTAKIGATFVSTKGTDLSKYSVRMYFGNAAANIAVYDSGINYQNVVLTNNQGVWYNAGSRSVGSNYIEVHMGPSEQLASESFSFNLTWNMGAKWPLQYGDLVNLLSDYQDRIELYYNGILISPKSKYH